MAGLRPQHALLVALAALAVPPALGAAAARAERDVPVADRGQPPRAAAGGARPDGDRVLARYAGTTGAELRIPLALDRSLSALTQPELQAIVAEINRIWDPAGICFEVRDRRWGYGPHSELVLGFVAADEPFVNGYYGGDRNIWAEDEPRLARAPTPATRPAARTAGHELGHALGLAHVPRTDSHRDALMNTGYDGYRLSAEEIDQARRAAARFALPLGRGTCRAVQL